MAKSSLFFCLGVLLLFSIKRSAGIQCYNCVNCNDPFDSNGVSKVDCTGGSCLKVKGEASGVQTVTRSCSAVELTTECTDASVLGVSTTTCACNTELCNGVAKQTAAVTLIVALAMSAYKLFV